MLIPCFPLLYVGNIPNAQIKGLFPKTLDLFPTAEVLAERKKKKEEWEAGRSERKALVVMKKIKWKKRQCVKDFV